MPNKTLKDVKCLKEFAWTLTGTCIFLPEHDLASQFLFIFICLPEHDLPSHIFYSVYNISFVFRISPPKTHHAVDTQRTKEF